MISKKRATSTQPEVNDQRIYSSKQVPTIRVRLKKGKNRRVLMIINVSDFDDRLHVKAE